MIFSALLAAIAVSSNAVTFTAVSTGVEKGASVEFMFIGKGSDHHYEALFQLEDSIPDLLKAFEKAGIASGKPMNVRSCIMRSVGTYVSLTPAVTDYITFKKGIPTTLPKIVFTGGSRDKDGEPIADKKGPNSFFAFFDCPQSPLVFDGIFNQGDVYGYYLAKGDKKKGDKVKFTVSKTGETMKSVEYHIEPGKAAETLIALRKDAEKNVVDAKLSFSGEMTVAEAQAIATAIASIDSDRVKINGIKDGNLYYRAFMPLIKWQERKERLMQPFELTVGETSADDKLLFIEEDWTVAGDDPKLTPREITFDEAKKHSKTETCFIYCTKATKLKQVFEAMKKMPQTVNNWYVFAER